MGASGSWGRTLSMVALAGLATGSLGLAATGGGGVAEVGSTTAAADDGIADVAEVEALTAAAAADGPNASLVRVYAPDEATVRQLNEEGWDLAEYVQATPGGIEIHVVATPAEVAELEARGLTVAGVIEDVSTWRDRMLERARTRQAEHELRTALDDGLLGDHVRILRAEYFESRDGNFLSVEAHHPAGMLPTDLLLASWDDGDGIPDGAQQMSRFTDAGEYMYHRLQVEVDARPDTVTVTTELGASATADVSDWVGETPEPGETRLTDFITAYMDPTEVYDRIEQLHAEHPEITELIELPYRTQGYARPARAVHGSTDDARVLVVSEALGHEGGNDVTVEFVDPGAAEEPLEVTADGSAVTVSLATDAAGMTTSTATEVAAALTDSAAAPVIAHTYRGSDGTGAVETGTIELDDGLDAPDHISREPFTVKALRIRGEPDTPGLGVLMYSQEHAREWVTPLVAVEAAERLVRNYGTDETITGFVDDLDIFIIPSVNPDGSHYSFYDYNFQRKNMVNHCGPEDSDPAREDSWGVDLNRNFAEGSRFDGYSGASGSCTSSVFAGPAELSEPEARNEVWLVDEYPNIRFAMNTHSYGNYFMWPPGAYVADGREPLPRPSLGEEAYFFEAGERILEHVKSHRGTVVTPARTGPVIDVLYSAAGNSADQHWYEDGVFGWDFEVGDIGFQPDFSDGHEEAMEFASGLIGMLEVAQDFQADTDAPASTLLTGEPAEDGAIPVQFETDEPATIHYTLDGTAPRFDSTRYESAAIRTDEGETLLLDPGTEIRWFAVDVADNVENGYDPHTGTGGARAETVG